MASNSNRGRFRTGSSINDCDSRKRYKCPVTGCGKEMRSDHLNTHFLNYVLFDEKGDPIKLNTKTYLEASDQKK